MSAFVVILRGLCRTTVHNRRLLPGCLRATGRAELRGSDCPCLEASPGAFLALALNILMTLEVMELLLA